MRQEGGSLQRQDAPKVAVAAGLRPALAWLLPILQPACPSGSEPLGREASLPSAARYLLPHRLIRTNFHSDAAPHAMDHRCVRISPEYLGSCSSIAAGDDVTQEGAGQELQGGSWVSKAEARAGEAKCLDLQCPQGHNAHRFPGAVNITIPARQPTLQMALFSTCGHPHCACAAPSKGC